MELTKNELIGTNGGNLKEAAFLTFYCCFKYSSPAGALLTGLTMGYLEQKSKG
jgi:hypothetical protein